MLEEELPATSPLRPPSSAMLPAGADRIHARDEVSPPLKLRATQSLAAIGRPTGRPATTLPRPHAQRLPMMSFGRHSPWPAPRSSKSMPSLRPATSLNDQPDLA